MNFIPPPPPPQVFPHKNHRQKYEKKQTIKVFKQEEGLI